MAETENKPQDEQRARRRLNMTLDSYTMSATPRTRKDRKQLRLTFGCSNGFPNVNADTDEDGEGTKENGWLRVSSRLNAVNFNNLCSLIIQATKEAPGWKVGLECYHTWKDGQQFEEKQHINDLIVGVDSQGLVFLSISQPGRTTNKYLFGPTEWHNYKKENGDNWGQKELNHMCAVEAATGLKIAMNALIAADCMDNAIQKAGLPSPSVKPQEGGGSGGFQKKPWDNNNNGGFKKPYQQGGGYNNNGGNGGYKKPYQQNGGGQGGFQKKPWENRNGGGNGGGGGYQKSGYQNNNGGNGGGFQKKWDNNGNQGGGNTPNKKPEANTEIDLDDMDF